jgi:hypothetical protein
MAEDRRILTPLFRHGPGQRMSFFVDEVMLFMKSVESDLHLCMRMFEMFGAASGPLVNKRKTAQVFRFDNFFKISKFQRENRVFGRFRLFLGFRARV